MSETDKDERILNRKRLRSALSFNSIILKCVNRMWVGKGQREKKGEQEALQYPKRDGGTNWHKWGNYREGKTFCSWAKFKTEASISYQIGYRMRRNERNWRWSQRTEMPQMRWDRTGSFEREDNEISFGQSVNLTFMLN